MSDRILGTKTLVPFALAALPLAVSAQTLSAAEPSDANAADTLNPVVVTATRAPRTASDTLSSVTVLDEATLRRQDPTDITDLLRGQPGVDVSSNGGFGKTSGVHIRGTRSNQSILMIDGIRLRAATSGGASWQFLDPRMFDRAEIVRGPKGSLYGADAVGGVVQLFTPKGEGNPTPALSIGGGSFNTQRASASLSGSDGGTSYHLAASRFDTDGYEIVEDEGDKGYDNTSVLARASHTFNDGSEVGVLALRARGNTEFDSFGTPVDTDYVQQVAGVYGELAVSNDFRTRLTLSEARDEQDSHYDSYDAIFESRTRTTRWENTLDVGHHQFIAGAEYRDDSLEDSDTGFGTYDVDSRDNKAVFTQALLDFAPLTVQGSLRFDDNEAYGDEVTGGLALGYDLDDSHTLRANYATAFRAPSFDELYYPGTFQNPNLEPETAKNIELGLRSQMKHGFWDIAVYQNDIDDLIVNVDTDGDGYVDKPENVNRARIRGVELSSGVEIDSWSAQAALTYTDPENRDTDKRLIRRASQSLRLDLDRDLGDWSVGGSWVAQNHRYNDSDNDERLGGYGIVNLRTSYDFAPGWQAKLTVDNALDKDYQTIKNYETPGRAAYLSVSFGAQ